MIATYDCIHGMFALPILNVKARCFEQRLHITVRLHFTPEHTNIPNSLYLYQNIGNTPPSLSYNVSTTICLSLAAS